MPRWRKATWAIVVFSALMLVWIVAGVGAVSDSCAGKTGDALVACEAGTAIGGGIAVTFLIVIWFIGFIVLGLIWLMSRPKDNVVVYGPDGQQVNVSEKEAKKRVEKGWTYQPPARG
ncbi:MAG: hypothetical protein ABI785_07815 [Gemmatimonadales bacterium]